MGTIEMSMSSYQAALLMLFNANERLTYGEIREQLNLKEEDVSRLLHSLSCAKHKVLKKEPEGRTVGKQDVFHFNESFTDKMRRIKIPLPPPPPPPPPLPPLPREMEAACLG